MNTQSLPLSASLFGKTVGGILAVLLAVSTLGHAQQSAFTDTFEAPFLILTQTFGTVTLSGDVNHTIKGTQSLKFTSSSGGQREMHATRSLASHISGTFSVWFYDVAPGEETLYEHIALSDSVSGWNASIGTQDFDAYCYMTQLYNSGTGANLGPNANCGSYPQVTTTARSRTVGWHNLKIAAGLTQITFSIDGVVVFTHKGHFTFDSIDLAMSGPYWRPDTVAYFDDLVVKPLS